jgi:hypothetical protein
LFWVNWVRVASAELGWAQAVVANKMTLIKLADLNTDNVTETIPVGF